MEKSSRPRHSPVLVGIGLVLVGLLSGILVMLFLVNTSPQRAVVPRVVERVELGRQQPVPASIRPDSGQTAPVVDVLTLNRLFKEVAGHVTAAVVYIQVESSPGEASRDWFHNFDEEEQGGRFFREMPRQSVGSGVVISDQGYIVTNHHVIDRASAIRVSFSDKREYDARVIGVDRSTDMAVIKIEVNDGEEIPVVALGNSDKVQVGEWVLAVGNPFRLTSTVTAGIVSALGRQVNIIEDNFRIEDFIQTDAAINPGNSGGALVNLQGELIGISTAIATESGSYEGYGFAVPVNLVERIVQDLIAYGEVQRGYLGVTIQGIDAIAARELGLDRIGGVYLEQVQHGSAAYQAGLRRGDVVLSVQGRPVNETNELQSTIARHRPGDQVMVEVWRGGRSQNLLVELLGREDPAVNNWITGLNEPPQPVVPEEDTERPTTEIFQLGGWGLGIRSLSDHDRNGFDVEGGVFLAYVENGSVGAEARVPRNVVIEHINDEPVNTVEDAVRLLGLAAEGEESVLFRIKRRNGLLAFYEVEVPKE